MARLEFIITLFLICVKVDCQNETVDEEDSRRHYGISFNNKCGNYPKVFQCMSACKSVGYQVFRLDRKCKCTCHEMKTTTILPFFKWRTNGTTDAIPRTFSIQLYHIVGTLSPTPHLTVETTMNTTMSTCPTFPTTNATNVDDTNSGNGTDNDANGTSDDGNGTNDVNGTSDDANGTSNDANGESPTNATNETINGPAGNTSSDDNVSVNDPQNELQSNPADNGSSSDAAPAPAPPGGEEAAPT